MANTPMLDARQFSTVTHAGTVSDPWPGSAILSALMALPATGGTVTVADGVWKIDSLLQLNGVNNFNLVGQSLNAQLMFTGAGQMWFGSASGGIGGVSNATISTLTINANTLTMASPQTAMRFSNAQNVSFNNNQILGHQNGSLPAVFFEGGSNNQFLNNTITAGPQGGAPLQLQTLGELRTVALWSHKTLSTVQTLCLSELIILKSQTITSATRRLATPSAF